MAIGHTLRSSAADPGPSCTYWHIIIIITPSLVQALECKRAVL